MENRADRTKRFIDYISKNLNSSNVDIAAHLGIKEVSVRAIMSRNGIKRTDEQLLKLQSAHGANNAKYVAEYCGSGSENPNWKGGVSKDNYRYKKLQVERYPERISARKKVAKAVKSGKLIKLPCFCGEKKVFAHHHDYSKPLEVTWLCRKHHREKHGNLH